MAFGRLSNGQGLGRSKGQGSREYAGAGRDQAWTCRVMNADDALFGQGPRTGRGAGIATVSLEPCAVNSTVRVRITIHANENENEAHIPPQLTGSERSCRFAAAWSEVNSTSTVSAPDIQAGGEPAGSGVTKGDDSTDNKRVMLDVIKRIRASRDPEVKRAFLLAAVKKIEDTARAQLAHTLRSIALAEQH